MNWLGDHASWNLFLLLPLDAVTRHPLTLLVVQSVALAAGGIAVDRLARREGPFVIAAAVLGWARLSRVLPPRGPGSGSEPALSPARSCRGSCSVPSGPVS